MRMLQLFCFAALRVGTAVSGWSLGMIGKDPGEQGAGGTAFSRKGVLARSTRKEHICCGEIILEEGASLTRGAGGTYILPRYCRENHVGCPTLGFAAEEPDNATGTENEGKQSVSCSAVAGCVLPDGLEGPSPTTTEEAAGDAWGRGPAQDSAGDGRWLREHVAIANQGHEETVAHEAGLIQDIETLQIAAAAEVKQHQAELHAVHERTATREADLVSHLQRLEEAADARKIRFDAELLIVQKDKEEDRIRIAGLKNSIGELLLAIRSFETKTAIELDRFNATIDALQAKLEAAGQRKDRNWLAMGLVVVVVVSISMWLPRHPMATTEPVAVAPTLQHGGKEESSLDRPCQPTTANEDVTSPRRDQTLQHVLEAGNQRRAKYLTCAGANLDLLQMMGGGGAVGGFADVTFWVTASGQELALKMAKDTDAGRRQQERETKFLLHFGEIRPQAQNIVRVVEARTLPSCMLLMQKEPQTLTTMLEEASSVNVGAVTKVLSGILNAIDVLDRAGYIQRDIKGDNILVGRNGEGILADFGLCVRTTEAAASQELFGDGTPEYSAPEVSRGSSGSNVRTEIFSFFVVFVESLLMRHPFCGKDLFEAKGERIAFLEDARTDLLEGLEEESQEQLTEASAALEAIRIQEWRLGVRKCREWTPNAAAKETLAKLGEPLSFFKLFSRRSQGKEQIASEDAKGDVSRLFEGGDWVQWLSGPSRADCKEGVKMAVELVLQKGALSACPDQRPQTVAAARIVLAEAAALYEECRVEEIQREQRAFGTESVEEVEAAGG